MNAKRLARGATISLALLCLTSLSACGSGAGGGKAEPQACEPNDDGPIVAIVVDTSKSTKAERAGDGSFASGLAGAFEQAAVSESTVWVTFADGNPVGTSTWLISGCGFKRSGLGGGEVQTAALRNQAEEFQPKLTEVLGSEVSKGSDLLGALYSAERLLSDFPDRPRSLVLLTDGALTSVVNVNKELPKTDAERKSVLEKLEREGQLPDLTGGEGEPVAVWIGGLGLGINDSGKARSVIELWRDLIPAVNGDLRSEDSTLRVDSDFPER